MGDNQFSFSCLLRWATNIKNYSTHIGQSVYVYLSIYAICCGAACTIRQSHTLWTCLSPQWLKHTSLLRTTPINKQKPIRGCQFSLSLLSLPWGTDLICLYQLCPRTSVAQHAEMRKWYSAQLFQMIQCHGLLVPQLLSDSI